MAFPGDHRLHPHSHQPWGHQGQKAMKKRAMADASRAEVSEQFLQPRGLCGAQQELVCRLASLSSEAMEEGP